MTNQSSQPFASPASMRNLRGRLATRLAFLVAGFAVSSWAPLIPFAKQRLGADDGLMGMLLLCLGAGSVTAMLKTGPMCARHGCKPVVVVAGLALALVLPFLALASTAWTLGVVLFVFGGVLGSLDVSMNVHAVEVEREADVPLMSGFHALFSVGGMVGAALVTFLLSAALTPFLCTLLCAAAMIAMMLMAWPRFIETPRSLSTQSLAVPHGAVLLLAGLAGVCFLVEGAVLDWSALLLTTESLSVPARAGLGYAFFSVAMTAGRFGGDAVTARLGDRATMFWGGIAAVLGFVVLLCAGRLEFALAGFVLIGLGASNIVPVLFRRSGAIPGTSAAMAVSAMTTVGYAGQLLGPAVVGFISHWTSLPTAFWVLAALVVLVPVSAARVTR